MTQVTTPDIDTSVTLDAPNFTGYIDQSFYIEPIAVGGKPKSYLDRFSDDYYNKSENSHLVKFLYVLLGPSGVGGVRKNLLETRIALEDAGLDLYDLDSFYGDPFKFGRITEEVYDEDPHGLLDQDTWNELRAKDARYRNRVIDFFHGARAGGTPEGIALVARSGIGYPVEIVENYKYLYDQHTDDHLGLAYYGKTLSTEEMIIIPRQEISRSEIQTITITGTPTDGFWYVEFNGERSQAIEYDATFQDVKEFLEALQSIDKVEVLPLSYGVGYEVRFQGSLTAVDVPQMRIDDDDIVGATYTVETIRGGIDSVDEAVNIPPTDHKHLQTAVDRIKPVTAIPTIGEGSGIRTRQLWSTVIPSSEYYQAHRYVKGSPTIIWPNNGSSDWIESDVEKRAPVPRNWRAGNYWNWTKPYTAYSYTDEAIGDPDYATDQWLEAFPDYASYHIGAFNPRQRAVFPFLSEHNDPDHYFRSVYALGEGYEVPVLTNTDEDTSYYNGSYPEYYYNLPGAPVREARDDRLFWASRERTEGVEYLEIDFGEAKAINHLSFETTRKPFNVYVDYDIIDAAPKREWWRVIPVPGKEFAATSSYSDGSYPWHTLEFNFGDENGRPVFTRFIRIAFNRQTGGTNTPFVVQGEHGQELVPFSIDVRNLRAGRHVSTG